MPVVGAATTACRLSAVGLRSAWKVQLRGGTFSDQASVYKLLCSSRAGFSMVSLYRHLLYPTCVAAVGLFR